MGSEFTPTSSLSGLEFQDHRSAIKELETSIDDAPTGHGPECIGVRPLKFHPFRWASHAGHCHHPEFQSWSVLLAWTKPSIDAGESACIPIGRHQERGSRLVSKKPRPDPVATPVGANQWRCDGGWFMRVNHRRGIIAWIRSGGASSGERDADHGHQADEPAGSGALTFNRSFHSKCECICPVALVLCSGTTGSG